jgi:amino acid transporter
MIPISGGAKEYLNAAFPKPRGLVTFVYTQVAIWLIMPGQTAAVATGAGMYLMTVIYGSKDICVSEGILSSSAYDYMARGISSATVITIVLIFSIIPRAGTLIQNYMSTLKSVVLLLALSVGAVAVCGGIKGLHTSGNFNNMFENSIYEPQSHISALFKVLFIFDGWGTINYSLSELKDPIRSMPLVTFGAFFTTFFLFLGTTVAYFAVVPITLLGDGKDIIAVQFFKMTMGDFVGGKVIPFLIL